MVSGPINGGFMPFEGSLPSRKRRSRWDIPGKGNVIYKGLGFKCADVLGPMRRSSFRLLGA